MQADARIWIVLGSPAGQHPLDSYWTGRMARRTALDEARATAGTGGSGGARRADVDRTEAVYRDIHSAIVERRLPPGAKLPESHLAEVFGVSRTLIRQALQRLVHEHLAVQEPNRGVRIAEPSAGDVRDLYEMRRLIECNLLTEAGGRLTRARLAELRRMVAEEAAANAAGETLAAMHLAGAFHIELAGAIGNPVCVDILRDLIARGNVALAVYEQRGRASCRCDEHRRILKHLANRDYAQAATEMREHLVAIEAGLSLPTGRPSPINLALALGRPTNKDRSQ